MADIMKLEMLKLKQILAPEFMTGVQELSDLPLPARTSYWISKSIIKLEKHLKVHEETRLKTLKKYAEVNEEGELVTEPETKAAKFKDEETRKAFFKELDELGEQDVEVMKISFDAIAPDMTGKEDKEKLTIKPRILAAVHELLF